MAMADTILTMNVALGRNYGSVRFVAVAAMHDRLAPFRTMDIDAGIFRGFAHWVLNGFAQLAESVAVVLLGERGGRHYHGGEGQNEGGSADTDERAYHVFLLLPHN